MLYFSPIIRIHWFRLSGILPIGGEEELLQYLNVRVKIRRKSSTLSLRVIEVPTTCGMEEHTVKVMSTETTQNQNLSCTQDTRVHFTANKGDFFPSFVVLTNTPRVELSKIKILPECYLNCSSLRG